MRNVTIQFNTREEKRVRKLKGKMSWYKFCKESILMKVEELESHLISQLGSLPSDALTVEERVLLSKLKRGHPV